MARNQYETMLRTETDNNDEEYVPSWSSRNKAMRALLQGMPQRELGEEITGFDAEQARRIFSHVRRPFDLREERPEFDTFAAGSRNIEYVSENTKNGVGINSTVNFKEPSLKFSEADNPDWENVNPTMKERAITFIGDIHKNTGGSDKNPLITSGYRDPERNKAAGGVSNSWHTKGMAVDLYLGDYTPEEINNIEKMARERFGEVLFHDSGTGLHLHIADPLPQKEKPDQEPA